MAINWKALKQHRQEAPLLLLDFTMMLFIGADLLWLLIDTLVHSGAGLLAARYFPEFILDYQQHWRRDVMIYDSLLTGLLLLELGIRWAWAVRQKAYHKWFFYPFAHWYDVLGCIPGLQPLRLLRLISIFYRLHTLEILLVGKSLVRTAQKYYNIILEEISDRIVINVLDGIEKEIKAGNQVSERIQERILSPHRPVLVEWLADRLRVITADAYHQREIQLQHYLEQTIATTIHQHPEWSNIRRLLPFIGNKVEHEVSQLLGSIVSDIAAHIVHDLGRPNNQALQAIAGAAFDSLTEENVALQNAVEQIIIEILGLLKAQVAIQQWKVAEAQEKS